MNKIKELREQAGMTRKEVEEKWGIPIRTLYNWEKDVRSCPDYMEDFLIEKLEQQSKQARIVIGQYSIVCGLWDIHQKDWETSWVFPIINGTVPVDILTEIGKLKELGYKLIICY